MAVRGTGSMGIKKVFAIGRHIFAPSVGIAVIDQRPQADGRRPGLVRPPEGDPQLTFKILFLFGAEDHIGFVPGHKEIAVKARGIKRAPEALDDRVAGRDAEGTEIIGAKIPSVALAAIAADIERSAVGGHKVI